MYEEIINEIKSNLTGDKEHDRVYLTSQMKKYSNHKYALEISREIGRMLWECLSDEEKDNFARISDMENPVKDAFDEAMYYMNNNDNKTALKKLDAFFSSYQFSFKDDIVNEYHSFSNPLEESLFHNYFKTDKNIRFIPPNKHYADIHYVYAFLLIEFKRLDEAEEILDYAIKLNPVSPTFLFERCEIFKFKNDFDSFYKYSLDALKYSYSTFNIARAYRNLGFYFIEKEEFEIAVSLFNFSLSFEFSPNAFSELEYIKNLGFKNTVTEDRMKELLAENNIQIGPNPLIINILFELILNEGLNHNINNQLYFYEILYDLTKNEEVLKKINELKEKLE